MQFHAFVTHDAPGVGEARAYIFRLEPRVRLEQFVLRVACRELPKHVLHCETVAANDRLAAEDPGIEGDALKELVVSHCIFILEG